MKKKFLMLTLLFFLVLSNTILASISLSLEEMRGYTNYIIQGEDNWGDEWKSKLDFPLNVALIGFNYENTSPILNKIYFTYKTNIDKSAGTFTDSDWMFGLEDRLIYAETKTRMQNAIILDGGFKGYKKTLTDTIDYTCNLGYQHQFYHLFAHDGWQINKTVSPPIITEIVGDALEYKIHYYIPYVGFNFFNNNPKKTFWKITYNFSPFIWAKDWDDHLLRVDHKISESLTMGTFHAIGGSVEHQLFDQLNIIANINYSLISTKGTQRQTFTSDIVYENIKSQINSNQISFNLELAYNF
ncbi:MAG: omptin family outer membrane protease [bacterium]